MSPVARNRNSITTATVSVKHTPTVSDAGSLLATRHLGSGPTLGGEQHDGDWILAPLTNYRLLITSEAASNDVSWVVSWVEE